MATFRDDDPPAAPKEIFVYHAAGLGGLGGFGGSSYIDSVILRDRDANTDWDAASDGVLEERIYYCQTWGVLLCEQAVGRHDVVALITEAGAQVQQIRYSAYGIPIGLPAGDVNSRGDVSSADDAIIAGWANTTHYDVRGDLNLDGVVTNADRTLLQANIGVSLGWGMMSLAVDHAGATGGGGNRKGYAGYEGDFSRDGFWHVRHRVLDSELGRFLTSAASAMNGYATSRSTGYIAQTRPLTPTSIPSSNEMVEFAIQCGGSCQSIDRWCSTDPKSIVKTGDCEGVPLDELELWGTPFDCAPHYVDNCFFPCQCKSIASYTITFHYNNVVIASIQVGNCTATLIGDVIETLNLHFGYCSVPGPPSPGPHSPSPIRVVAIDI